MNLPKTLTHFNGKKEETLELAICTSCAAPSKTLTVRENTGFWLWLCSTCVTWFDNSESEYNPYEEAESSMYGENL